MKRTDAVSRLTAAALGSRLEARMIRQEYTEPPRPGSWQDRQPGLARFVAKKGLVGARPIHKKCLRLQILTLPEIRDRAQRWATGSFPFVTDLGYHVAYCVHDA